MDSFYVGKLKGVGKVWQLTACDCGLVVRLGPVADRRGHGRRDG